MQTRPICHLAQKLRAAQYRFGSWRVAAAQLHVFTANGEPSPGIAYYIAECEFMPSTDLLHRLIRDGAIPRPQPKPLNLDPKQCRAIVLALRKREPLPQPTAKTVREFSKWLQCRRSR
jgi:hypothetical protein